MTIPVSGEVLGLTTYHDQRSGMLIALYWRPNQTGRVNIGTWTGQGKWYVVIGQKDDGGAWTWSTERQAFTGANGRPELKIRPDGVVEFVQAGTTWVRTKSLQSDGTGSWS